MALQNPPVCDEVRPLPRFKAAYKAKSWRWGWSLREEMQAPGSPSWFWAVLPSRALHT